MDTTLFEVDEIVKKLSSDNPQQVNMDGYTLTKYIGHGAFAHVFEAHKDQFGRIKRALKLPINNDAIRDIKTRQTVLSALGKSDYSVNLADHGEFNGLPFIAEELGETSLAEVIYENNEKGHKPSLEEIVSLGRQLLKGLDYFHNLKQTDPKAAEQLQVEGLTHNDIKPANIMGSKEGRDNELIWRYNDFGVRIDELSNGALSVINSASLASIRNNGRNGRINRNIYASPEVRDAILLGDEVPATVQSDLYSVGAVVFAFATGAAPKTDRDPRKVREDLPESITPFFEKILHGDPDQRFTNASEALSALELRAAEREDSYLVGVSRTGLNQYTLFKQPLKGRAPMGSLIKSNIGASDDFSPVLRYLPEDNLFLLLTRDHKSLRAEILDEDFKSNKSITFEDKSHYYEKVRFDRHELLRNTENGDLVLNIYGKNTSSERAKKWKGYPISLPELEHRSGEMPKNRIFNKWENYKPKVDSTKFFVFIKRGNVEVGNFDNAYEPISLEGFVNSAFLIDAKK